MTVVAALFILYGLVSEFPLVLFIASWGYILVSMVLSLARLFVGKRATTLEDFEPDDSDDEFH
jgi:CDP-diacylglycerol--serine O-phosphatidyltransferase